MSYSYLLVLRLRYTASTNTSVVHDPVVAPTSIDPPSVRDNYTRARPFFVRHSENLSAKKILDFEGNFGKCEWRNDIAAAKRERGVVAGVCRIAIHEKQIVFQVFDPIFRNSE